MISDTRTSANLIGVVVGGATDPVGPCVHPHSTPSGDVDSAAEVAPLQAVKEEALYALEYTEQEATAVEEANESTPCPSSIRPIGCPSLLLILPMHSVASTPDCSLRRDLQLISLTLSAVG